MHSAAGIEDRLFTPARIRLTAWYVSVLAAVLIVLGTALYLVVRQQLLNGVDNGVKLVAARATERVDHHRQRQRARLSTGPYTVNFLPILGPATRPAPRVAHRWSHAPGHRIDGGCLRRVNGTDLRSSGASGDRQRVYSVRVTAPATGWR